MPLSPIRPTEEAPVSPPRALRLPLDPVLTLAIIGLGICSAVTLGAATRNLVPGRPNYYVERQATYLIVGFVLMLGLSRLDYARLRSAKNAIYAALILSILAVLALGHAARGSTRAINFPFFSFQASELGKVLLIVALAAFVAERTRALRERDTTVRVMIAALIPAMFVIVQPDLGSGMVYMVVAYVLLFVAGASWRHLAGLAALVAVSVAFVLVAAPAAGVHVLKPYQTARLTAFLHPSSNPQKEGYQQQESKIAIGAGQKTGRGANSSQIPNGFVPESHTDFIFAAVGEQYGFVGAGLVLLLYGLLISRALRVLVMSKDLFGSLIAAGVAAMLMFQVFVNVGMTIGIMPITGVTLPLMSYGGSSVITTLLAVGLLQSIYVQARASAALKDRVLRY
ncbi:MAG: rodA [Solirubrobacterales bacterium]|jgi:rod shape determining protein RodA|nr:rodA [Solirubrobacterales bacterium]MCW3026225.1 rodA [Solirubrobacterales bacterium]